MTDLTTDTQTQTAAESPDSALANWQAQSAPLAVYAEQAQAMRSETEAALGALYEHAELSGDDAAKERVMIAWERTQQFHNQIVNMDAGLAGAGATIQALDEQRRAALDELKSIVDAIADGDETHPQLQEFAQDIRMDEYEYAAEMEAESASEYVHESLYEEIDQRVREIFGQVDDQTSLFVDFLYGNTDTTPYQKQLFTEFVESLREPEGDEE